MTTHDPDAPQEHESKGPAIRISAAERGMLIDAVVAKFTDLAVYYECATERGKKRRLQTEMRALSRLLHKLQGSVAATLESDE